MKKLLILSLLCLFLVSLISCGYQKSSPANEPVYYSVVKYEITGTADFASVTLANGQGGTEQYSKVLIPWTYIDEAFAGDFLYVSAQNQGQYGTVTVSIYIDGERLKSSESSGAHVIATASGFLWR